MTEITNKLEREFIQACGNANGQFLTAPGHLDCLLRDKPFCVFTLYSGSSKVKVETNTSYIEMSNVKSISSIKSKKSSDKIIIHSKKGDKINIGCPAPDHIFVGFKGNLKGGNMVHNSQRNE